MNIFVTDKNPIIAAQNLCDLDTWFMANQSITLLLTFLKAKGIMKPYSHRLQDHACSLWLRKDNKNVSWLIAHTSALLKEYSYRTSKIHSCEKKFIQVLPKLNEYISFNTNNIIFIQSMPDRFKNDDSVIAYRDYYNYRMEKNKYRKYSKRGIPEWLNSANVQIVNGGNVLG